MELISNYSWHYTVLCLIIGFVFSALLYFKDKKNNERSKKLLYTLITLRFVTTSFIALLLLNIFIKQIVTETEKPVIIFAQDNSSSIISTSDSLNIKQQYIQDLNSFLNSLKSKYDVKTYQFDSDSDPSENFNFKGNETDISKVFLDIENNYVNKNIGAVIISTDGIYNKGTNPLYSTQKINAPIYSIALGDTTPLQDVWIQTINHNQVAYLGNSFPVEVIVNAFDLENNNVVVSISSKGKTIATQNLNLNSTNFSKTLNFLIEADKPGVQTYQIDVSKLDKEKNQNNNTQSFVVDVIDNREKILILAQAPHPDIAAIEQSISSSQTYEVETELISNFSKPLKPYSLIIFHQTSTIPPRIINEIKANNQSAFLIGTDVLNPHTGINIKRINDNRKNDIEAVYQKDFTLFTISNELQNFIKEFPAVKCNFTNTISGNGVNSLICQKIGVVETEYPLLYFTENNGIKSGGFTGDGLWRWKMRDFMEHNDHRLFNELISKTIQYLSVKADKSFFRVFTKKIINENEILDFTAEVYNQSYELVTDPEIQLVLKDEKGKIYNYTFSKKQNMYQLSAGRFPAGNYTYEAKVKQGEKLYTKSGFITIKEIVAETINTVANHQLLHQISTQSGGKLFYKNQLNQLEKEITANENITSITYSHKQLTDLINLKWLFLIMIILLGTEWFLRKYNGKV